MKKYIKTNKIRKGNVKLITIIIVIPIIIMYNIIFSFYIFKNDSNTDDIYYNEKMFDDEKNDNNDGQLIKGCIIFSLICGLPISIMIFKWILKIRKLNIEKSEFRTIKDIEYFRDKLEDITPIEISLLTDLEIEDKKDLVAILLRYYKLGIINFDNNEIKVIKINDDMQESDKIILREIKDGKFNLNELKKNKWKEIAIDEASKGKYLKNKNRSELKFIESTTLLSYAFIFIITYVILMKYGEEVIDYIFYMIFSIVQGYGQINFLFIAIPVAIEFILLFKVPFVFLIDIIIEKKKKIIMKEQN